MSRSSGKYWLILIIVGVVGSWKGLIWGWEGLRVRGNLIFLKKRFTFLLGPMYADGDKMICRP